MTLKPKNMITKQCENPKCKKPPFQTKNTKKLFHDVHCKNQADYWNKVNEYDWEILMQKFRKGNIKILEHLFKNEYFLNSEKTLEKFGFDFSAVFIHYFDDLGNKVYRFGNLGLIQVETNPNSKNNIYKIVNF